MTRDIGRGLLSMLFGLLVSPLGIPFLVLFGLVGVPTMPLVLLGSVCLLAVPLAVCFAGPVLRTDNFRVAEDESGQEIHVDRRALPRWLWWFQTPDEMLPGALYEKAVIVWLGIGWHYCAIRWLWRNAGYGLAWAFGQPADRYLNVVEGLIYRAPLWRWRRTYGPIALMCGWKVHRANFEATAADGPYWAIPFVSIRLKGNS